MRKRLCFVLVLLLGPTAAEAHDHIADFFVGYCHAAASKLPGVQFTVAKTFPAERKVTIFGDFNFNGGEHESVDIKRFVYLGGVRFTPAKKNWPVAPSIHISAGSVVDNDGPQEGAKGALSFGGALDYMVGHHAKGLGARFQLDYVVNGGDNYARYSVGLVYRIHEPEKTPTP